MSGAVRPVLSPSVRRLWRDPETLQVGRPPGRAVVLAGVDAAVRRVLGLLDGTRERSEVLRAAGALGASPAHTDSILGLLDQAELLDDASGRGVPVALDRAERDRRAADLGALRLVRGPDTDEAIRRRRRARVVVAGAGRVGAAVAGLLAAAGIGTVDIRDDGSTRPEDCGVGGLGLTAVGRPRGEAAQALLGSVGAAVPTALPDLVVLAPPPGLPGPEAPRVVPYLVAEVRGDVGVVGPLVVPGASACLHCLDLARTDSDPDWPALALQLDSPAPGVSPCDSALALAVAAQTALQALAFLDGGPLPATAGGTLELVLPGWRWRRRSWQLHPDCGCGWSHTG